MRKTYARMLTAILATAFLLVQGTWVLAGTTGSISGIVGDNNGAPVARASVSAVSPSQSATTTTDGQGRFAFVSLSPDTYTITISKSGYQSLAQPGITVTADQDNRQTFTVAQQLQTIGRTRSRTSTELVKAGTIQDVYTINPAQQVAAQGLGGGGSLNQAYSAISSLPGVYVPQGQQGWAQSVYIRGGNYTNLGYEYDGIPTQRAFDAYPGGTVTALGQQELQVYTGSAPADAASNGLAGFINQVIKTGTYPTSKTLQYSEGMPAQYHKGQVEISGATPSRSFSYYLGGAEYTQNFRYGDQFNGSGYSQTYNTSYANVIQQGCPNGVGGAGYNPNLATAPCYAIFGPTFVGPSGYQALPLWYGFNNRNSAGEVVGNFHIGIPTKSGRDDIQILANSSWNRGYFDESLASFGPLFSDVIKGTGTFNGQPYLPCSSATADPNFCGINDPTTLRYADSYRYFGPVGTPLTAANLGNIGTYIQPKSLQHPYGGAFYNPNSGDQQDINASIFKLQYQKNFGTDAYLRLYGYTFYTSWINGNGGPAVAAASLNGTSLGFNSPDYELVSHERGASATFVKQLSDKNLLNVLASYVTATTVRNNNGYYAFGGGPVRNVAVLVNSTNPTNGICYRRTPALAIVPVYCGAANVAAYRLPAINGIPLNGQLQPSAGAPTLAAAGGLTCGTGPCEYFTVDSGYRGSYNTVKPQFSTAAISDTWKPNASLTIDAALKFENFVYQLPDTTTPANYGFNTSTAARNLYTNSYNLFNCFGGPTVGYRAATAPGVCPAGYSLVNFSTASPGSFRYTYLSPRIGATLQLNRDNVLRFSAGQFIQPTETAYTQYNRVEANVAAYDVPKFYSNGYTNPAHAVRPEKSQNFDLSWEHQFRGSDTSFSLTPFYRHTIDEDANVLLDPVTNFVSAINVGEKRVQGVELFVRKGDFTRNGLSAQFSYTYTNAKLKFKPLPSGTTALDGVNSSIKTYNGFTSFCAANPTDARCGSNSSTASACYTTGGAPTPCVAGTVANPYWNAPVQALFDPTADYIPYNQLPGTGLGGVSSSYVIPHVATLILNWRHDKLAITPSLQFEGGGKYGAPVNGFGIDPSTCTATLGIAPDPRRYSYGAAGGEAYDAASCAGSITAPDFYTGRFDGFGAFTEPSALTGNLQVSYDISKRVTLTVLGTNIYNRCFGGTQAPWTRNGDGRINCWYTSPNVYTGNFFNPGTVLQNSVAFPYASAIGNVFQQAYGGQANPFNLFVTVSVKL